MTIKIVDQEVTLIDYMGSDLRVADAARVSFNKQSELDEEGNLKDGDKRLISYLANHNHWTPFAHCSVSFRIKAPFFVARQLGKHQVGLVWNEVSRRYVDSEPEFYLPEVLRQRAENKKQGSSDAEVYGNSYWLDEIEDVCENCLDAYNRLLYTGVCPEQARMVLPQNTMTEWYWSGSLMAFARVCNQRLDPHAQKEVQDVAKMIDEHCSKIFPHSWKELMNE